MSQGKTCSIEGCERKHKAHDLCSTHLYRRDNGLPMEKPVRQYEHERICKVDGCDRPRTDGGDGTHCQMHRKRVIRRGDPGGAERQRAPFNEAEWNKPNNRRRKKLLAEYGLTVDEYDRLFIKQKGRCAICGSTSPKSQRAKSDRSFCIDHDHATGQVRGLLCSNCNRALGMFNDDPDVLEAAVRYVRHHRQVPLFGPAGPVEEEEQSMPITMGAQGDHPGPSGQSPNADGESAAAPMDMGQACQAAADASMAHAEAEGRKVAMGVSPMAE